MNHCATIRERADQKRVVYRAVWNLASITVCERSTWILCFWNAWLLGIVMSVRVSRFTAQFCKNTERFDLEAISLWATVAPHAPPGGFSETTIFLNLIHIAIGTRVPAKILMLDKAIRALFVKWLPKRYKCYNFIILKQICFIFDHGLEQKEYRIVQI